MKTAVVYVHGKKGSVDEADHYKKILDDGYDVIGFDYKSAYPWDAKKEFFDFFTQIAKEYPKTILIANSLGAYFSLISLSEHPIEKAMFISPVVNMEKLIFDMMKWAKLSEEELKLQKEIRTSFGETLSWQNLSYVREHPTTWNIPTCILYGENDHLTSLDTMTIFANSIKAKLTVLDNGEHWFHTREQMDFLDHWILENI